MTIILFLIDTSASMAQKNYKGSSCLDLCKAFVSEFIKARGRDVSNRGFDRYMLLSTEEYPSCVKELRTAWRENALMEPMKSLKPTGRHSFCSSIQTIFRLLNLNRSTTGIDNYGYGRFPYYMEPVFIFSLTDGTAVDEMIPDFKLDFKSKQDLTKDVFRWDQKFFSVVFRVPASHPRFSPLGRIDPDTETIDRCCASTGGRSFSIVCHKQISQCIDVIIQTMQQPGISVRFQCPVLNSPQYRTNEGSSSNDVLPEVRLKKKLEARPLTTVIVRMVGGKPITNHWPIPEGFWHTRLENGSIPVRSAQPTIIFMLDSTPSQILSDFPFDKYEIESSPVVDYILEKFKDGKTDQCLQVFVHNSGRTEGYGKPFGYLKVTSSGTGVNLFLMPYNYPVLIQLLQELKNDQSLRSVPQWRKRLDSYLENVPPYYLLALRKNLIKWKINGGLLDEQNSLSQIYPMNIINMLNRLKPHAKDEYDKLCASLAANNQIAPNNQAFLIERRPKVQPQQHWKTANPKKSRKDRDEKREVDDWFKDPADMKVTAAPEKTNIQFHMSESKTKSAMVSTYRNPLILNKTDLVDHLPRMCANIRLLLRDSPIPVLEGGRPGFNIKLHHADELHSQPIALMGNYEEYIKSLTAIGRAPLREIEEKPVRTHAFGNPFKTKSLAIDEVGEGPAMGQRSESKEMKRDRKAGGFSGRPPKRKPGALAQNSLGQWRDRRKTLSERSSIMSDSSYMKDIDEEVKMVESSSNEKIKENVNGISLSNGDIESSGQASLKDWGLEEEYDESMDSQEGPSVVKKPRFNKDLPQNELRNKKIAISSLIRRISKDQSIFEEIRKTIYGGSSADSLELYEFSIRDSQRFKRKRLTEKLNIEIRNLKSSINGVT
ncbi:unnamed protein product [Auanema sp. JU1783]|nr:unnamed protein product [Auanema sp. JU1783]